MYRLPDLHDDMNNMRLKEQELEMSYLTLF